MYSTHRCERRFLEFSSGIPFKVWRKTVARLEVQLRTRPAGLLDAPGGAGATESAAAIDDGRERCAECDPEAA